MSHSGVHIVSGTRHPVKHSALFCAGSVCCSAKDIPGFTLVIITKVVTGRTLQWKKILWDRSPNFSLPYCYLSSVWKVIKCLLQWPSWNFRQMWLTSYMLVSSGCSVTSCRTWTSHVFLWCNTNTSMCSFRNRLDFLYWTNRNAFWNYYMYMKETICIFLQ